jgi:hypothetical protein
LGVRVIFCYRLLTAYLITDNGKEQAEQARERWPGPNLQQWSKTHMSQAAKQHSMLQLPKNFPKTIRKSFEAAIEAHLNAVAALTAALDQADGDSEAEPSLGSFDTLGNYSQELWANGTTD